jgi:hypothetical protein
MTNRKRTDNIMTNRKRTKRKTKSYKTQLYFGLLNRGTEHDIPQSRRLRLALHQNV